MDEEVNQQQNFTPLDYSLEQNNRQDSSENGTEMVDYMLSNPQQQNQIPFVDKLSFAEVMQFADFGPKLALNQRKISEDESYFLKFQGLGDQKLQDDPLLIGSPLAMPSATPNLGVMGIGDEGDEGRLSENASSVQQQLNNLVSGVAKHQVGASEAKSRRKRPRSMKTTEEVESQRMTHIAVERNRRRQMNEHLRMLRSLMPGSYVQRGDQASIIGGAIEFVRELEQLLQCLESQKRRRLFGNNDNLRPQIMDGPSQQSQQQPLYPSLPFPNTDQHNKLIDLDPNNSNLREEMAENKSCVADIEVRLLGFDAMIKILSRRRPGQLIKTIAALEELQFNILHTNITTIEQTVLYSFNVKIVSEARYTAEDIANSVQQILSFIESNTI